MHALKTSLTVRISTIFILEQKELFMNFFGNTDLKAFFVGEPIENKTLNYVI